MTEKPDTSKPEHYEDLGEEYVKLPPPPPSISDEPAKRPAKRWYEEDDTPPTPLIEINTRPLKARDPKLPELGKVVKLPLQTHADVKAISHFLSLTMTELLVKALDYYLDSDSFEEEWLSATEQNNAHASRYSRTEHRKKNKFSNDAPLQTEDPV